MRIGPEPGQQDVGTVDTEGVRGRRADPVVRARHQGDVALQVVDRHPDPGASVRASGHRDHALTDGDVVSGRDFALEAIATPGHTANHMAFALRGQDVIFSGDHVMGWSSSIVAPPDGAMSSVASPARRPRRRLTAGPSESRDARTHRVAVHEVQDRVDPVQVASPVSAPRSRV
jgi:glyoxylase-like metal-dependent hydrolase (beta-lactamase superfamily II)